MQQDTPLSQSSCQFTDHETVSRLKNKRLLGLFVNELVFHYTRRENILQYVFVNDLFLHDMNLRYLQHDTYTDIITFDLSDPSRACIDAEIYISTDRVKENAEQEKVKYLHELYRVIIHGALHLSGFADKTKAEREKMRALENEWIEKYLTLQNEIRKIN